MKHYTLAILPIALLINPITAHASACPSTELVFARGTNDSPGVGAVGDSFAAALKPGSVYGVNYPASMDFNSSVLAGVSDTANHIESMAAQCPRTRIVLGGFSQGAAVAAFVTSDSVPAGVDTDLHPLSDSVAAHIKAVVLFGLPNANFSNLLGVPQADIGGRFQARTRTFCIPGDPVCDGGSDFQIHCQYAENGMTVEAATFARNHL